MIKFYLPDKSMQNVINFGLCLNIAQINYQ